jgi:Sulfotransferase family
MSKGESLRIGKLKPILVCGAPRSGTTWVGRMLALSPALYYVHEPFNPSVSMAKYICNAHFQYRNIYITEENEQQYYRPIKDMLLGKCSLFRGLAQARSYGELRKVIGLWREFGKYRRQMVIPLIKDPTALMSAGWLARRFDINVVVMIRHPAAFVNSMKNRNWPFYPSRWALPQSLLMRDYLSPFEKQMIELEQGQHDIIDQTALLWKILNYVVLEYKKKNKNWIFLRHEDIAMNPIDSFRNLYDRLALVFSDGIRQAIYDFSKETNPVEGDDSVHAIRRNSQATVSGWKCSLTSSEIRRIRMQVEEVSSYFYLDSDWN